jgi:hypothetical protein
MPLNPEAVVATHRRTANLGPLHDLLIHASRKDAQGRGSITFLAEDLGLTAWAVYKWLHKNDRKGLVTAANARKIVAVSEGRVTFEDFIPFLG